VDYYLVKRGRYDVQSFFTPDGIYGRIQWWARICYVITLAVQVPFLDQLFTSGRSSSRWAARTSPGS
jgi:nucleobase:cation symporter-1, NCS1 family